MDGLTTERETLLPLTDGSGDCYLDRD